MKDTVCVCNHWYEEHDNNGECGAPGCDCRMFLFDPEANTAQAIADRGGDPDHWPDWMKRGELAHPLVAKS